MIDRITVYEDHIEVELLADIDEIINAETKLAAQKNRVDTASDGCVTVISEGEPPPVFRVTAQQAVALLMFRDIAKRPRVGTLSFCLWNA